MILHRVQTFSSQYVCEEGRLTKHLTIFSRCVLPNLRINCRKELVIRFVCIE